MANQPRRRLLVDSRVQTGLIGSFLLVFVAATGIFCAITWGVLIEVEGLAQALGMPATHPFLERLGQLRVQAALAMLVTLGGVIALVVYGGLLRTRRIVGPIVALQRRLERGGDGAGEGELHARRGDHFAELLASFDRWMQEHRAKSR